MNSQSLISKAKNLSIKNKININTIIRFYMYECFLKKLYLSEYKFNFIIKGGFYLSSLFGLENRTTMDIDAMVKNVHFSKHKMEKIIKEIIDIPTNDNIEMRIDKIEDIRENDEYGGFRFTLVCKLDNIREKFHFDIATGDPITPSEISYNYKMLFSNDEICLLAYNIETVLAEKIETIMSRNVLNSRMKDYYDVYIIITFMKEKINFSNLKHALYETFKKRGSLNCFSHPFVNLGNIKYDNQIKQKWKSYQRKYDYAKDISFFKIIDMIEELISVCEVGNLQFV